MTRTVDLLALQHNARAIKEATNVKLCAVLKSNAYGQGLLECSRALDDIADCFAVVSVQDAVAMRKARVKSKILLMSTSVKYFDALSKYDLIQSVSGVDDLILLDNYCRLHKDTIRVDIEVNSGFNRLGIMPQQIDSVRRILDEGNLALHGMYTHFCDMHDREYTEKQHSIFVMSVNSINAKDAILHCCTSKGLGQSEYYHDMVRCGIALFGLQNSIATRPVVHLTSYIVHTMKVQSGERVGYGNVTVAKDCTIATVLGGYGQGLIREVYSSVVVRGVHCSILAINMDYFMVDTSGVQVNVGDIVDVIGHINPSQIAMDKSIDYQLLTSTGLCRNTMYKSD